MQDDTLWISDCVIKTTSMNAFLNTRTNLMNLQFGNNRCVKMHIGKTNNIDLCSDLTIDAWKEEISEDLIGRKVFKNWKLLVKRNRK